MKIHVATNREIAGFIARSALERPALKVSLIGCTVLIEGPSKTLEALVLSVDSSLRFGGGFTNTAFTVRQCNSDFPFAASWLGTYNQ